MTFEAILVPTDFSESADQALDYAIELAGEASCIDISIWDGMADRLPRSPEAQLWFDRGLNWSYAFHREEALRCFKKIIELDADCAMAYWGFAYATGPYYNSPWEKFPRRMLPATRQSRRSGKYRATISGGAGGDGHRRKFLLLLSSDRLVLRFILNVSVRKEDHGLCRISPRAAH